MLRIIQNSTAKGAKSYYSSADYYTEGQELVGEWRGNGAARLGLQGVIAKEDWDALCDNKDPGTGETLTARQRANRRVGYDINFHAPKSVSLLYGLTGDERILAAFKDAVGATMHQMEAEVATRVRSKGRDEDRTTGNLAWGEFVHFTARPVEGVPDPHLHAHCFAFNATWDDAEGRWKAAQFAGLKRDAPYFEAAFHARLAMNLRTQGFEVERARKGWELAGVPRSALQAFSRRTALIEAKARERGITDPGEKAALGAKTRARKAKSLSMDELRREWWNRLSSSDRDAIARVPAGEGRLSREADEEALRAGVDLALEHCFERRAVVPERSLFAEAMRRSYGVATPEAIEQLLGSLPLLRAARAGERLVTTQPVLDEEQAMVAFARDGRGSCERIGSGSWAPSDWLDPPQRQAVEHVLRSRDRVLVIRGAAGTGKTAMMREAVAGIEAGGYRAFVFAPSAEASRGVLRAEGFAEADTVARLLLDEQMQDRARGQVVWVDEAGLLGTRTMARLFDIVRRLDARLVLSGDRRQHGSVERGSALALLEDEAGLVPAELKEIRRQRGAYKEAVKLLSEGRTADGFRRLDALGWVRTVAGEERNHLLAREYGDAVRAGKSALVVSPTHHEGESITHEIRSELQRAGKLGSSEESIPTLVSKNLTLAERRDRQNYEPGDVAVFHQNAKGFTRGQRVSAEAAAAPVDQAERYEVYRSGRLHVAAGDVLRITRNGKTKDGRHRLNNGQLVTVRGFTEGGDLVLANGWTVARDYGHLAHGYVVTSHASQGKTVDRVLIGQSATSAAASSREQFYVSVSRGRESATIYTDDKEALLEAVSRGDDRISATELLRQRGAHLTRRQLLEAAVASRALERQGLAYVR